MSIKMSAPILESHKHVGDFTQAREVRQENTHAAATKENRNCKHKLTGLQIKAPRSCDHPCCLVEQIAESWGSEAAASENNPARRSVRPTRARMARADRSAGSFHNPFEQASLRSRRERLHEVHPAMYPSCSALGPKISAEAAIGYDS